MQCCAHADVGEMIAKKHGARLVKLRPCGCWRDEGCLRRAYHHIVAPMRMLARYQRSASISPLRSCAHADVGEMPSRAPVNNISRCAHAVVGEMRGESARARAQQVGRWGGCRDKIRVARGDV